MQWIFSHRGVIHSYTVCISVALIFAFFYPIFALPFFLGYSFHLLADSFTPRGIKPFWTLKFESKGVIKTGGKIESGVFAVFVILDFILLIALLF